MHIHHFLLLPLVVLAHPSPPPYHHPPSGPYHTPPSDPYHHPPSSAPFHYPPSTHPTHHPRSAPPSALSILLAIAPSSSTCVSAPIPSECSTAAHAAPYLITSMSAHNITHPAVLAALLSLIAFETGEFKYNTNHFPAPGRPGQGTRNMQTARFNLLYARSMPELRESVEGIVLGREVEGLSDEEVNAVRALVLPDRYAWGSAGWFLNTQCSREVREGLEMKGEEGWRAYLACVGVEAEEGRREGWERARGAFGIV